MKKPNKLPEELKPLFWDTNFETLNPHKKSHYIINRIFDKGNIDAIRWVRKTYPENTIKFSLMKLRDFSLKSATFWATIYDIPFNQMTCLQEPYLTTRQQLWPH